MSRRSVKVQVLGTTYPSMRQAWLASVEVAQKQNRLTMSRQCFQQRLARGMSPEDAFYSPVCLVSI